MQSLRIKLAVGVAVLGVAGVGTAAIAHDRARYDAFLTGYEESADDLHQRQRRVQGADQPRRGRDPLLAGLHRPVQRQRRRRRRPSRRRTSTSGAARQRRDLGLAVRLVDNRPPDGPAADCPARGPVTGHARRRPMSSGRAGRASRRWSSGSSCERCGRAWPTPTCTRPPSRRRDPRADLRRPRRSRPLTGIGRSLTRAPSREAIRTSPQRAKPARAEGPILPPRVG